MPELSPAAQVVLDVFTEDNCLHDRKHNYYNLEALAAALRAAADQVVPANGSRKNNEIRDELLIIVEELEAQ